MKQYFTIAAAWLLAALFISPATFAGVIIQPAAASTDMGTSVGSPDNVINQSGLLVGYTSGVTDFDDYYFSTPGHNSDDNNAIWASGSPFLPGNFDFDLGAMVLIESMIIWNCDNQRGVYGFNLLADDNPAFSSPTVLGSFLVDNDGPGDRMAPHPLPFAPTFASHVRMEIISNNGPDPLNVQMGEVAFEQVPEPTPLAADFNGDDVVDGDDLSSWTGGFGAMAHATHMQGDADGDADVDGGDFLSWQQQVGSLPVAVPTTTVPEPTTLFIAVVAAIDIWVYRRRNR